MTPPPDRERSEIPSSLPSSRARRGGVPFSVVPLVATGESQVRLVEDAMRGSRMLGLFLQSGEADKPNPADLRTIGTAAVVHRMTRRPDGSLQMVVQGIARIRLSRVTQVEPYLSGQIEPAPEQPGDGIEFDALANTARDLFQRLVAARRSSPTRWPMRSPPSPRRYSSPTSSPPPCRCPRRSARRFSRWIRWRRSSGG